MLRLLKKRTPASLGVKNQYRNNVPYLTKQDRVSLQCSFTGYKLISVRFVCNIQGKPLEARNQSHTTEGKVSEDDLKTNNAYNYLVEPKNDNWQQYSRQVRNPNVDRVASNQALSIPWLAHRPYLALSLQLGANSGESIKGLHKGSVSSDENIYNIRVNEWILENFANANYDAVLRLYLANRSNSRFSFTLPNSAQSILASYKYVGSQRYMEVDIAKIMCHDLQKGPTYKLHTFSSHFKNRIDLMECQLIYIRNLISSAYDHDYSRGVIVKSKLYSSFNGSNVQKRGLSRIRSLYAAKCNTYIPILKNIITAANDSVESNGHRYAIAKLDALTLLHQMGVESTHWSDLDRLHLETAEHYTIWMENIINSRGYEFAKYCFAKLKERNLPEDTVAIVEFQLYLMGKELHVAEKAYCARKDKVDKVDFMKISALTNSWIQALANYGYIEKAVEVLNENLDLNSGTNKKGFEVVNLTISKTAVRNEKYNRKVSFQLEPRTISSLMNSSVEAGIGNQVTKTLFLFSRFVDMSARSKSAYLIHLVRQSKGAADSLKQVFSVMQSFVSTEQSPSLPALFETIDYLMVRGDVDTAIEFLVSCLNLNTDGNSLRNAPSRLLLSEYLNRMLETLSEKNLWDKPRIDIMVNLFKTILNSSNHGSYPGNVLFPSKLPSKPGIKLLEVFWNYNSSVGLAEAKTRSSKQKMIQPWGCNLSVYILQLHLVALSYHISFTNGVKSIENEEEYRRVNKSLLVLAKQIFDEGFPLPFSVGSWLYYYLDHYMPNNIPINTKFDVTGDKGQREVSYSGQLKKQIRKKLNTVYGGDHFECFFDDVYSRIDEWNSDAMASIIIKRNPIIYNLESYTDTLLANKRLTSRKVFELVSKDLLEFEAGNCPINVYRKLLSRCGLEVKYPATLVSGQGANMRSLNSGSESLVEEILKLANRSIATIKTNPNCQRFYKKLLLDELIVLSNNSIEGIRYYDDIINICGLKPNTMAYMRLIEILHLSSCAESSDLLFESSSFSGQLPNVSLSLRAMVNNTADSCGLVKVKNKVDYLINEAFINEYDNQGKTSTIAFHVAVLNKYNKLGYYDASLDYYQRMVVARARSGHKFGSAISKYLNYEVVKSYCNKGDWGRLEKFLKGLVASNSHGSPDFSASISPFSYTIQYLLNFWSQQSSGSIVDKPRQDKLLIAISDMVLGSQWPHGVKVDQVFLDLLITALLKQVSGQFGVAKVKKGEYIVDGVKMAGLVDLYHRLGFNRNDELAWHAKVVYAYGKHRNVKGLDSAYEYAREIISSSSPLSLSSSAKLLNEDNYSMVICQALIQGYLESIVSNETTTGASSVDYYKRIVRLITHNFESSPALSFYESPLVAPKLSDEIQGMLIRAAFLSASITRNSRPKSIQTPDDKDYERGVMKGLLKAKTIFEAFEAHNTVGPETLEAMVRVYLAGGDRVSGRVLVAEYENYHQPGHSGAWSEKTKTKTKTKTPIWPIPRQQQFGTVQEKGKAKETPWDRLFVEFDRLSQPTAGNLINRISESEIMTDTISVSQPSCGSGSGSKNKPTDGLTSFGLTSTIDERDRVMRNNCQFKYINPRVYLIAQSVVNDLQR